MRSASRAEGDGSRLTIGRVVLPRRGYVVVYDTAKGAPATVRGSVALPAGSHRKVEVRLSGARRRNRTRLMVLIHAEDGESDGFDFPDGDPPLTDDSGVIALAVTFQPD